MARSDKINSPAHLYVFKSRIFTDAEQRILEEHLKGSTADKNGLYSARVKPKLKELVDVWLPRIKEIKKLLRGKRK